ncbi:hypothetical protein [Corynebacterium aquilae]|uniref:GAP1-N2 domain-containing protein n=1 Tax=Corynebacterium aquilae TaxID=203263 RepID=UPI00095184B2|nr:hypothetical protein [Corynebacterium aquilae]
MSRFAQVTFASFASTDQGSGPAGGGWRVGPTLNSTQEISRWVAAQAPTAIHPTTAVDDFLSQEDIDNLPRRFEYVPPALGPEGYAAYLQSVPAGNDNTGRPGNVFTHAFIDTDPTAAAPVPYPTDAYRGASFKTPFRKTAVNTLTLDDTQPSSHTSQNTATSSDDNTYATAWLVVSQLLGDRTGALWALHNAVQTPGTLAVLLVQNNLDAGYWLTALSSTTTPSMARATWRLSTFERAGNLNPERMLAEGYRIVCVPAVDKAALSDIHGAHLLSIIDPTDAATFAAADTAWSQLTRAALPANVVEQPAAMGRLAGHLITVSDAANSLLAETTLPMSGAPTNIYAQALALAIATFDSEYPPQAVHLAREILGHSGTPLATGLKRHLGGSTKAWEEVFSNPTTLLTNDDPLLLPSLDTEGMSVAEKQQLINNLADVINSADTRGDTRGHARAQLVHRLLITATTAHLIDDYANDTGATAPLVSTLAESAAFAAHLGSHDPNAQAPEALAAVVRSAFTRRHSTPHGNPHPDWALRAGTTTTPTARAAYGFAQGGLTKAEDTAGNILAGRPASRGDIQHLLSHITAAEIAAVDLGSRPPGAHSNDSVTDLIALLKSRGHGSDVSASRVEDIRHQRRLIAQIHPAKDLVDIIGALRGVGGRDIAELSRTIHPDLARSHTFLAAALRLWIVLVPYAKAYPLLPGRVTAEHVASLAEVAAATDTNIGPETANAIYERFIRADLIDATRDVEVLAAAGQWLRYLIAGVSSAQLGRLVAHIGGLIAEDPLIPADYRQDTTSL